MTTVLWVLGVWLLASIPLALFIGQVCSLNRLEGEEGWITSPLPADQETFSGVRIVA
jgi:hypothetical protein